MLHKFKVTRAILHESEIAMKQGSRCSNCLVAIAIKAGLPGIESIIVTQGAAVIRRNGEDIRVDFPSRIGAYIKKVDRADTDLEALPEFEFELDI